MYYTAKTKKIQAFVLYFSQQQAMRSPKKLQIRGAFERRFEAYKQYVEETSEEGNEVDGFWERAKL